MFSTRDSSILVFFRQQKLLKSNICESEVQLAGVLSFKYTAVGPESNSRLQFDRFDFSDESLVVVGQERTDTSEQGYFLKVGWRKSI